MYKVTNIDKTPQILYDKGGKKIGLNPGESANMVNAPQDSYTFKVENLKVNHIEKIEKKEEPIKLKKEVK